MSTVTILQADPYSKVDGISRFVSRATKYNSTIQLTCDGMTVNAKSIMGVAYFFSAAGGREIKIVAEGEDENAALDELQHFLA